MANQENNRLNAFKANDIRGRVPEELDESTAYRIGFRFAEMVEAGKIVIGYDVRLSSPKLAEAVSSGVRDAGGDVTEIGLCGTEMMYFAVRHWQADGGIMVTASHNPADYNGMKIVRSDARPLSADNGLNELAKWVCGDEKARLVKCKGNWVRQDITIEYVKHLLSYLNPQTLRPLKIVTNAGHGCAGPVLDALAKLLPFEFISIQHEPDGTFPAGVPNPLLPENRHATAEAVCKNDADFGIAWDGDFDRCFLFDEKGRFIEGYYMVGLLAESFLRENPGETIIHDPRLVWNTLEIAAMLNGRALQSKTGHAFIKERMREVDAIYGGEMSAHHYFRDFGYCDSGMIPWLLIASMLSASEVPLSAHVEERMARFPVSGEINSKVEQVTDVMKRVEQFYCAEAVSVDRTDGLSIEYPQWRFNLRTSNTEPLLRLNVETRGDETLLAEKTQELLRMIRQTENE